MTVQKFLRVLLGVAVVAPALHGCGPFVVAGAATGVLVAADRRSAGTIVDDNTIEVKIANRIASDKALAEKVHVSVNSYNRTVLLTGEVPTRDVQDQIVAWAGAVEGVKQVYNALDLANPSEYKSRNFDVWLSSKVKSKLAGRAEFDASHIKVTSENAVVYLMGLVKHAEAEAAAKVAAEVEGAKRVVTVFEYLE